jgi:SAM-dependent methyltransferase
MALFKTEVTSDALLSDNPIHQRLLKPYVQIAPEVQGTVVEIGCGDGRGVELLGPKSSRYLAIDKNTAAIRRKAAGIPQVEIIETLVPPLPAIADATADRVISFQVIEHIEDDVTFLQEIHRILKPGGRAYISTVNKKLSLSRNPWHVREYTAEELLLLAQSIFPTARMEGITGNQKVMDYYEENKRSVARLTRFDVLDLQHRLPAGLLKIPYELMNRLNRLGLSKQNNGLVSSITHEDYVMSTDADTSLDLFLIAEK